MAMKINFHISRIFRNLILYFAKIILKINEFGENLAKYFFVLFYELC